MASSSKLLPKRRMACGLSFKDPSAERRRSPLLRIAWSILLSKSAETAASSPSWRRRASKSKSVWSWRSCSARRSSSARSCMAPVPSPKPMPSSPEKSSELDQSNSGRSPCRLPARSPSKPCSSGEPKACADNCINSSRCSGDMELSMRCAAAERCAKISINSLISRGFSGKCSPCLAMKSAKSAGVSVPVRCLLKSSLRSRNIAAMACLSSSVAPSRACFMPENCWSNISRPSKSRMCSNFSRASWDCQS